MLGNNTNQRGEIERLRSSLREYRETTYVGRLVGGIIMTAVGGFGSLYCLTFLLSSAPFKQLLGSYQEYKTMRGLQKVCKAGESPVHSGDRAAVPGDFPPDLRRRQVPCTLLCAVRYRRHLAACELRTSFVRRHGPGRPGDAEAAAAGGIRTRK